MKPGEFGALLRAFIGAPQGSAQSQGRHGQEGATRGLEMLHQSSRIRTGSLSLGQLPHTSRSAAAGRGRAPSLSLIKESFYHKPRGPRQKPLEEHDSGDRSRTQQLEGKGDSITKRFLRNTQG